MSGDVHAHPGAPASTRLSIFPGREIVDNEHIPFAIEKHVGR